VFRQDARGDASARPRCSRAPREEAITWPSSGPSCRPRAPSTCPSRATLAARSLARDEEGERARRGHALRSAWRARSSRCTPRLAHASAARAPRRASARPRRRSPLRAETRLPRGACCTRSSLERDGGLVVEAPAARRPAQVLRHMMAARLARMRRVDRLATPFVHSPPLLALVMTLLTVVRGFPRASTATTCPKSSGWRVSRWRPSSHLARKVPLERACGAAARRSSQRPGSLRRFATAPPLALRGVALIACAAALFFAARVATYEEAAACAGPS